MLYLWVCIFNVIFYYPFFIIKVLSFVFFQQPTWRLWGEEKAEGAIYTVYLKKVRYHRPTKSISTSQSVRISFSFNYCFKHSSKLKFFIFFSSPNSILYINRRIKRIFSTCVNILLLSLETKQYNCFHNLSTKYKFLSFSQFSMNGHCAVVYLSSSWYPRVTHRYVEFLITILLIKRRTLFSFMARNGTNLQMHLLLIIFLVSNLSVLFSSLKFNFFLTSDFQIFLFFGISMFFFSNKSL